MTLKEETGSPKEIADILLNKEVIDSNNVELINEANGRAKQTDILLKAIVKSRLVKKPQTMKHVVDAFESIGRPDLFENINQKIGMLLIFFLQNIHFDLKCWFDSNAIYLKILIHDIAYFSPEQKEFKFQHGRLHHRDIKRRLIETWHEIEDEVDPLALIDPLLSESVLTFDEHQNLIEIEFKPNRMMYLCEYVLRKPPRAFVALCSIMQHDYKDIADRLLSQERLASLASQQGQR